MNIKYFIQTNSKQKWIKKNLMKWPSEINSVYVWNIFKKQQKLNYSVTDVFSVNNKMCNVHLFEVHVTFIQHLQQNISLFIEI